MSALHPSLSASRSAAVAAFFPGFTADTFLEQHWDRRPLHLSGALSRFGGLFDAARIDALLAAAPDRLGGPGELRVRAIRAHDRWLAEGRRGPVPQMGATPGQIPLLLAMGASIEAENLQVLDPALLAFANALRTELSLPGELVVHTWMSLPGPGIHVHFDQVASMIVQVEGEKIWSIADRVSLPWPRRSGCPTPEGGVEYLVGDREPWEFECGETGELRMREVVLRPGDVLYLPAGVFHCTRNEGEGRAVAVNFSFRGASALDVIVDVLRTELERRTAWRTPPVAPGNDGRLPAALKASFGRCLEELREVVEGIDAEGDALNLAFQRSLTAIATELPFRTAATAPAAVSPDLDLRMPTSHAVSRALTTAGALVIFAGGKEVTFEDPELVAFGLALLERRRGFRAGEAVHFGAEAGTEHPWGRVAEVLGFLLGQGVLEVG